MTNDTFAIKLNRGENVRYEVGSVNEERGSVEIQLLFANPSNISNKLVSYASIASSIGTRQTWGSSHSVSPIWKFPNACWTQGRIERPEIFATSDDFRQEFLLLTSL